MSQVKISQAFNSPDLLHNCLSFLRDYAAEKAALAACAVVPLSAVAYPQVPYTLYIPPSLAQVVPLWVASGRRMVHKLPTMLSAKQHGESTVLDDFPRQFRSTWGKGLKYVFPGRCGSEEAGH